MTPQKYVPILIVWRFFGLAPVLQTILQNSTFRRFILWAILLKVLFTVIFKTEFATICEQKPSSHYLTQWWLSNRQLIVAVLHKTGLNFPWINMPKIHVLWYPFVTLCLRAGYTETNQSSEACILDSRFSWQLIAVAPSTIYYHHLTQVWLSHVKTFFKSMCDPLKKCIHWIRQYLI